MCGTAVGRDRVQRAGGARGGAGGERARPRQRRARGAHARRGAHVRQRALQRRQPLGHGITLVHPILPTAVTNIRMIRKLSHSVLKIFLRKYGLHTGCGSETNPTLGFDCIAYCDHERINEKPYLIYLILLHFSK